MDSILISIKKLLGISKDYTHFDQDIIIHINSVFMLLYELGVGTKKCFSIEDSSEDWEEFTEDKTTLSAVKSYMYLKVKLLFDPPSSGIVMDAMERNIKELEWRLNDISENEAFNEEVGV